MFPCVHFPCSGSLIVDRWPTYSSVHSQRGIPVATVAINGGMNAGLLAVRISGAGLPHLFMAMDEYLKGLENEVLGKVEKLAVAWVGECGGRAFNFGCRKYIDPG
jgi:phosphoribosylaminoimidazole carboxylase